MKNVTVSYDADLWSRPLHILPQKVGPCNE